MELKILLFTLLILFAAFGNICSKRSSSSVGHSSRSQQGRFNSSSALRPWATVPPPKQVAGTQIIHRRPFNVTTHQPRHPIGNHTRFNTTVPRPICTDFWSVTSPCRPFNTVPPPIYPGPWYPTSLPPISNHHQPWRSRSFSNATGYRYGPSNGTLPELRPINSTTLYPSLSGVSESQSNGTTLINVSEDTRRGNNSLDHGHYSLRGSGILRNVTTGEINPTNHGNSSSHTQSRQFYPDGINPSNNTVRNVTEKVSSNIGENNGTRLS